MLLLPTLTLVAAIPHFYIDRAFAIYMHTCANARNCIGILVL